MRRTGIVCAVGVVLLTGGLAAGGATAEEVIAKHIEARGGKNWDKIESIRCSGTFTAFSEVAPFTLHKKRADKYHMDQLQNGRTVVIGHDGSKAWWDNHWFQKGAQPLDGQDLAALSREFNFVNSLFDYEERGYGVELIGETEYEGYETIGIKLERGDGSEETWYLDPETYLEVARVSPGSDFGQPTEQRTFFDDFREVAGVMIPHYTETQWYTRDRVMQIDELELNVEIDDALFAMPTPPGMGPLLSMVGDWTVAIQRRQQPGAPFEDSEGSSKIESMLGGALLRARSTGAEGNTTLWDLAYDQARERYRMTAITDRQAYINVLEGTIDDDGVLMLSNVDTGTTLETMGMSINMRASFHDITDAGFAAEFEMSVDGGQNWMVMAKQTFSRGEDEGD